MTFLSTQSRRDTVVIERFGELYDYVEIGEPPRKVRGVFENPMRQSSIGERPMSAVYPMISVLKSQVPNLGVDDQFDIEGELYRVRAPSTDEGEIITAKLEKM